MDLDGVECLVSRSGYTGEDGYEISVPAEKAEDFARKLLAHDEVEWIGLGAVIHCVWNVACAVWS